MVGVVCLSAAACGGKGGNSPTSPSSPSQSGPTTQSMSGTVPSLGYLYHPISITGNGNMTLTLSWQGGGDLDLYLTSASCNDYPLTNCQVLAVSDNAQGGSEIIVRSVFPGEQFKVWVDNWSDRPINYSLAFVGN
jgi:hypothetical protein